MEHKVTIFEKTKMRKKNKNKKGAAIVIGDGSLLSKITNLSSTIISILIM